MRTEHQSFFDIGGTARSGNGRNHGRLVVAVAFFYQG